MLYRRIIATPMGEIIVIADSDALLFCGWKNERNNKLARLLKGFQHDAENLEEIYNNPCRAGEMWASPQSSLSKGEKILIKAVSFLNDYFGGKRIDNQGFDIPPGTEFQRRVWKEISLIPYGETITYKELARRVGCIRGMRAVAQACGANPISVIIPCHRVTATNNIGGYAGGVEKKIKLLEMENDIVRN